MRLTARALAPAMAAMILALAASIGTSRFATADDGAPPGVIHQLRIYEIFEDTKAAFHARFRDHALRIMARYDFKILAMWEARTGERTEFVYLLEWPDEATKAEAWRRFMADSEWNDIKARTRGPRPMVGEIQDRTIALTEYSPAPTLRQ